MPMNFALAIEPLEARIAPAVLLSFTDVDGDKVNIVSDKALSASVSFTASMNPSELLITGAGLDGASLATVVTKGPLGDGLVNIGRISAVGLDLGAVKVSGDLGKIVCGNANNPLPGLKSLTVRSMGIFGLDTQGAGNLVSTIDGDLVTLTVAGDVVGAQISANKLGTVKIGGDLRGTATTFSGRIQGNGIGKITIGGDLAAGAGDESGKLKITGDLGSLSIGGSLYGAVDGTSDPTGQIYVTGTAGPITIKRDFFGAASQQRAIDLRGNAGAISVGGSLLGLAGADSAAIYVAGNMGPLSIGRELSGGSGPYSGSIVISGNTGPVKIGRDLIGSTGGFSAALLITGKVNGTFSIGGDVRGGTGTYMDGVALKQVAFAGATSAVRIGGDILGNTGRGSATVIINGDAPSVFIGGTITGGGGEEPNILVFPGGGVGMGNVGSLTIGGSIRENGLGGGHVSTGNIGKLLIKGSIFGTTETNSIGLISGPIVSVGNVGTARIEGSIAGASTPALSSADYDLSITGNIMKLEILGSLDGASSYGSGSVRVGGNAGSIKIGGSLLGSNGKDSGSIAVGNRLGALTIGGGIFNAGASFTTAQVVAKSFGKVAIGGDLLGGNPGAGELRATTGGFDGISIKGSLYAGGAGGAITAAGGLGPVSIGGSISGSFSMNHNSIIGLSAKSITIGGDLLTNGSGNNALINIRLSAGPVKIGGSIRGATTDPAILEFGLTAGYTTPGFTSLSVKGSVNNALIFGGVGTNQAATNTDATLGPIAVGGDWIASTVAAGVSRGGDMLFATGDDTVPANGTAAPSKIAGIVIKGQILGTAASGDHFGFVAQRIGPVKSGPSTFLSSSTPFEFSAISDDVTLRLVP